MSVKFNKNEILEMLLSHMIEEFQKVEKTVSTARNLLTEKDMQQEGKYDTRRIEAGYLAGAQGKRLEILKQDIQILRNFEPPLYEMDAEIGLGALVKCRDLSDSKAKEHFYFIIPSSGGISLKIGGEDIQVLSIHSPLGNELMRLEVGETVEIETPGVSKELEILALY